MNMAIIPNSVIASVLLLVSISEKGGQERHLTPGLGPGSPAEL